MGDDKKFIECVFPVFPVFPVEGIEHLGGTAQEVLSIDVAAIHDVQVVKNLVLSLHCQLREQYGGTQVRDRRRYTLAQLELSGRAL